MILGGALGRSTPLALGPRFILKGGVALELRLRAQARATRDLDLILNSADGELVDELEAALSLPYEGFSFRRKGEPEYMPNGAARVEIAVQFSGKPWGTVRIDVARRGPADGLTVELIDAISLEPFGLNGPPTLPCLSLPYQIAQKLHALTLPSDHPNERFRDLVDVLQLREHIADHWTVLTACRQVFAHRDTHAWPPFFKAPAHWEGAFERLAREQDLPFTDVQQAALPLRVFINSIDDTARLFAEACVGDAVTVTTWYFEVVPEGGVRRITARAGEAALNGSLPAAREPDEALVVIGVVLLLRDRRPVFLARASPRVCVVDQTIDAPRVALAPGVWQSLAQEITKYSRAPAGALSSLVVFLQHVEGLLPCELAAIAGITPREVAKYILTARKPEKGERLLWDFERRQPVLWV